MLAADQDIRTQLLERLMVLDKKEREEQNERASSSRPASPPKSRPTSASARPRTAEGGRSRTKVSGWGVYYPVLPPLD